jgi:putative ABC transport system substrate-binding protein
MLLLLLTGWLHIIGVGTSPAFAQPASAPDKVYRLGVLGPGDATSWPLSPVRAITIPELAKLGFVEGRNLAVDARYGPEPSLPEFARDLVDGAPDVIVAVSRPAILAARQATASIPIVMSFIGEDPVAEGLVHSLARPGGNVTGLVMLAPELDAKRLDLLREAIEPLAPAARIAVLIASPRREDARVAEMRAVAARRGLELLVYPVEGPGDYAAAFRAMRAAGAEALSIVSSPVLFRDPADLASRAREAGLPTVCEWREMALQGCLLGYGPSLSELRRRTADYVARLFRGAAPGELPIERPTRYEFAINLRTAQRLGLELPPPLLLRADEVIE